MPKPKRAPARVDPSRLLATLRPKRPVGRPRSLNWEAAWIVHELIERHGYTRKQAAVYVLGDGAQQADVESLLHLHDRRARQGGAWKHPWAVAQKAADAARNCVRKKRLRTRTP